MRKTTSLRLPERLHSRLASTARQQGTTLTALVERYAREGLATDSHPGIVFMPGPAGRRATLAGGPDIWEVIAALQATSGSEQDRVAAVAQQCGLHVRQVGIAIDYAAAHPTEVQERIAANEQALAAAEQDHKARQRLLDRA